jgi:DNA polymerase III gamma/tau subunit
MADLIHSPLTEQYRPKSWAEIVGQEKIVNRLLALRQRGLAGRAS